MTRDLVTPDSPAGTSPRSTQPLSEFSRELLKHSPVLMARARRLTRDDSQAADLVQDTLLKALRAQKQYQEGTNLLAWLLKILRNTFITRYHRSQLERGVVDAVVSEPLVDGWIGTASMQSMREPEANALRPDIERRIRAAVQDLPDEFRQVVLLADVEGYSYREIAEDLGCPIGTVMSRLYRARRQLRSSLEQHAIDLGLICDPSTSPGAADQPCAEAPIELDSFRSSNSRRSS